MIFFLCLLNPVSILISDHHPSSIYMGHGEVESKFSEQNVNPRKNRAYPLEYKLMIVEEAKRSNNSIVARTHGIDKKRIRDWRKDELKIRESLESGQVRFRLEGAGRKAESFNVVPNTGKNIPDHKSTADV